MTNKKAVTWYLDESVIDSLLSDLPDMVQKSPWINKKLRSLLRLPLDND